MLSLQLFAHERGRRNGQKRYAPLNGIRKPVGRQDQAQARNDAEVRRDNRGCNANETGIDLTPADAIASLANSTEIVLEFLDRVTEWLRIVGDGFQTACRACGR